MTDQTESSQPKYTVSGNRMRVWRLDADGQPTGEPVEYPGPVKFDLPAESVEEFVLDSTLNEVTMELSFAHVDPALLALLTGQGTPPEEIEVYDLRSRWQRFVDWLFHWWWLR